MQKEHFQIIAKTFYGLEETLSIELEKIGAKNIKQKKRAVSFLGDKRLLYLSNLKLRTALRILKPISALKVKSDKELYKRVRAVNWNKHFSYGDTFAIDSVVNSKFFPHSKYAALKVKDAIVDQFRDKYGKRPSVDVKNPNVRLNIHITNIDCTISLDSSGESLHKRGYRLEKTEAPLNEVLAAGLIFLSQWDGKSLLIDPMCGSGTIPIEACLIAKNISPGLLKRKFGFMNWKDYDERLWNKLKSDAKSEVNQLKNNIIASDISGDAIKISGKNIERAGLKGDIKLMTLPFEKLDPPGNNGLLIMNPPYGERLKKSHIEDFYTSIGDTLKSKFDGFNAWILSANKDALKHIGLRTSRRLTLFNGPLESKFHKYSLYKGSKKKNANIRK